MYKLNQLLEKGRAVYFSLVFKKKSLLLELTCRKILSVLLSLLLLCGPGYPGSIAGRADAAEDEAMPAPGQILDTGEKYNRPVLKGIKLYPDDPFKLDFIIDRGREEISPADMREESVRIIRYFLTALTFPEKDLWVNLSPNEPDRIIPDELSLTDMGKDMLAQDYVLKQIVSSLTYPESETGADFWDKVYSQPDKLSSTGEDPINMFNKIWIMPDSADIYQDTDKAFIASSRLKVMLEKDYLSRSSISGKPASGQGEDEQDGDSYTSAIKETLLPRLEEEVNNGKNFSSLRQIYNSILLAAWFKIKFKENIINKIYSETKKIKGIDFVSPEEKDKIYNSYYMKSFKDSVYDVVKESYSAQEQKMAVRRYLSGGVEMFGEHVAPIVEKAKDWSMLSKESFSGLKSLTVRLLGLRGGVSADAQFPKDGYTGINDDDFVVLVHPLGDGAYPFEYNRKLAVKNDRLVLLYLGRQRNSPGN
ncbi:MAG: hypothetical protein AB1650_07115 [Candidatus Omnitrophota bacterium]